ncbi:FAD-dependent oxidoreductase [bacterium]|nr:FAD-dependent oxidoreductase [bacterium]
MHERRADIIIIGGGMGGVAAALAAARQGRTVILTEETDWIGGQLTAQAVPPDEHPWIEQFGCTRSYREYRNRVREYYRRHYPLTADARVDPVLNPGRGGVSRLCHEPRVSLAVLDEMLAPHRASGRVVVLLRHRAVAAEVDGDRLGAVQVRDLLSGDDLVLRGAYFLDATELGDLLPLAKVEYVIGAESRAQTGEPHAPEQAQPLNMQAISWCFAIDHLPGEDHTIDRPRDYGFWHEYVPNLRPPWPGKLLSWVTTHPITLAPRPCVLDPDEDRARTGEPPNFWRYRRIAARGNFVAGAYASDVTLVNWPQMDYWLGPVCEVSDADVQRHLDAARQLSLSVLYWMQTEAPRPDGGTGWKGLRLRGDLVGTTDGLAKYPYIREARRIRALFTVLEQHVGTDARMAATGRSREEVAAEEFPDSVGVGCYRIDLHPSTGNDNYIDISSLPFQIPLAALIPVRMENLLAAGKNIGTTHITNGCYRLHPVEWNIGEAAGALAAHCVATGRTPRGVRQIPRQLEEFQSLLARSGLELQWPQLHPV